MKGMHRTSSRKKPTKKSALPAFGHALRPSFPYPSKSLHPFSDGQSEQCARQPTQEDYSPTNPIQCRSRVLTITS